MASKVCLLTLAASRDPDVRKAKEQVGDLVSDYFSDAQLSADFRSQKELVDCLHSQLPGVHTVIVAAEPNQYNSLKLTLMNMLSLRAVKSRAVADAIAAIELPDDKERRMQVAMPEKSRIFLSSDGLYSGFAAKKGSHCIILLPLDCVRLDYMLVSELTPFLTELSAVSKRMAARVGLEDSVRRAVDSLAQKGTRIAVSNIGSYAVVRKCLGLSENADKVFVQDENPSVMDADDSINNYLAGSARVAKEYADTDVGIAVSNIYSSEDGETMFAVVSIANSERARVVKVYGEVNDDPKALVLAAISKLLHMLDEFAESPDGLVNPNGASRVAGIVRRIPIKPLVALVACLFAAIICCIGVAFYLSGNAPADAQIQNSSYLRAAETINSSAYDIDFGDIGPGGNEIIDADYAAVLFSDVAGAVMSENEGVTTAAAGDSTTAANDATEPESSAKATSSAGDEAQTKATAATTQKATAAATTTTKKATTTKKPTTTKKATTTKATTTTEKVTTTKKSGGGKTPSGTFTFVSYGFGHGVGMSQLGAVAMANSGSSYEAILLHYYPGTKLVKDSSPPKTVSYGGKNIELVEYLCRSTVREIGSNAPHEALKAQACTIYTYAKYYDFKVSSSQHAYNPDFDYLGDKYPSVLNAVLDYLGMKDINDKPTAMYVDYNGAAAFTCYFADSPGQTADAVSVWGGASRPYLEGGVSSPEPVKPSAPVTYSAEEMKALILAYDDTIVLSDDPSEWIEILEHDDAYNKNIGYVETIRVGNKQMKGNAFRAKVLDYGIRSHCFTLTYTP